MFHLEFIFLSVYLALCLLCRPGQSCNVMGIQSCMYHEDMKLANFNTFAFISEFDFKDKCSRYDILFGCMEGKIKDCKVKDISSYRAFADVQRTVCKEEKEAYRSSWSCLDNIEGDVSNCNRPFLKIRNIGEMCEKISQARQCVRDVVKEANDCSATSQRLMAKLIDRYFEPYAHPDKYNCHMEIIDEDFAEAATTTTSTPRSTKQEEILTTNSTNSWLTTLSPAEVATNDSISDPAQMISSTKGIHSDRLTGLKNHSDCLTVSTAVLYLGLSLFFLGKYAT